MLTSGNLKYLLIIGLLIPLSNLLSQNVLEKDLVRKLYSCMKISELESFVCSADLKFDKGSVKIINIRGEIPDFVLIGLKEFEECLNQSAISGFVKGESLSILIAKKDLRERDEKHDRRIKQHCNRFNILKHDFELITFFTQS